MSQVRKRDDNDDPSFEGLADFASEGPPGTPADVHSASTTIAVLPESFYDDLRRAKVEESPTAKYKVLPESEPKEVPRPRAVASSPQAAAYPPPPPVESSGRVPAPPPSSVRRPTMRSPADDRRLKQLDAAVKAAFAEAAPRSTPSDKPEPVVPSEAAPRAMSSAPPASTAASTSPPTASPSSLLPQLMFPQDVGYHPISRDLERIHAGHLGSVAKERWVTVLTGLVVLAAIVAIILVIV